MKYQNSKHQGNEVLRMMIPFVSRNTAVINPMTFTVWYEYLAGVNASLKSAMSALLEQGEDISDACIQTLYDAHVIQQDERAAHHYEDGVRKVVADVSIAVTTAHSRAGDYATTLAVSSSQLVAAGGSGDMGEAMQRLVAETAGMRDAVASLSHELKSSISEIEELRLALDRARKETLIDPLTGLRNRRGLERELDRLRAAGVESLDGFAFLVLDIDHFKKINDTHGHVFGDKVIRMVAELLNVTVGEAGVASRWGGEEFLVLLPPAQSANAGALAEKVRQIVERGRIRRGDSGAQVGAVTVSVGVTCGDAADTLESVIRRADEALYRAKQAGRNRVISAA